MVREFKKLRWLLDRAEEVADGIARMLIAAGMPVPEGPAPAVRQKVRSRDLEDPRWERMARRGVGDVRIGPVNQGIVPVAIDGAPAFHVTPAQASLFAVLLTGDARDEDGFPPFRDYREIAAAYSVRTGRPESERAVVVGLGRLRRRLMTDGGVSPRLVETLPRRGARFRIRRPGL